MIMTVMPLFSFWTTKCSFMVRFFKAFNSAPLKLLTGAYRLRKFYELNRVTL